MSNNVAHARLPYPIRGARFTIQFGFSNPAGDAVTHDTEISKDGGAFADAAEEATAISGGNAAWLTLTGAETDAAMVMVQHKNGLVGIEPPMTPIYPLDLLPVLTGNAQAGSTTTLQLEAGTFSTEPNAYRGMILKSTGGTGGGGAGGANNQAVVIESSDPDGTLHFRDVETAFDATTDYVVGTVPGDAGDLAGVYSRIESKLPNVLSLSNINGQVDTALADIQLDHLFSDAGSPTILNNTLWARLTTQSGVWADFDQGWHSLQGLANTTAMIRTVITAVTSQTAFTIANGSAESGVYAGCVAVITDVVTGYQKAVVDIITYDGPTNEVTLSAAPAFTITANDFITILNTPNARAHRIEMDSGSTKLASIVADTNELQVDWVNGGRLDLLIDAINAKTTALPTDPADQSAVEAAITASVSTIWGRTIESGVTAENAMKAILACLAGLLATAGQNPEVYQNPGGTKNRVTVANDVDGNRTAITFDFT